MSKEAVDIKGTRQGLIICLDPNLKYEDLKTSLINKMESAQGFFAGAQFAMQPSLNLDITELKQLENICRQYGLIPNSNINWSPKRQQQIVPPKPHSYPDDEQTLLVSRTLRSGHRITYPGHITVLGDINPGAEVVAGGNIIIMGTCSGFVHAGANRKQDAYIIAVCFKLAQLRIADAAPYQTSVNHFTQTPACARLGSQGITISRYDLPVVNRKC